MIIRPEQHWFLRLFDWHGSVLSKIIFRLLLNVLMSIIAIISYQWYEQLGIHLTVAPFSLLGIAIAIFLGFRNSASYNRFVEARNLWGTVLIAERTLMRQLKNILPTEHQTHQKIASYLIAFSWSLKHQLRKTHPGADLNRLLPPDTVAEILGSSMPTNRILLLVGHELGQLREAGKVSDITYGLMDNKLDELAHVLGPFRIYLDSAAYGLSVLHLAAFRAGRRSALHDAVRVGLYLLHLLVLGFAGGRAGRSVWHRGERFTPQRHVQHHRTQPVGYDRSAPAAGNAAARPLLQSDLMVLSA